MGRWTEVVMSENCSHRAINSGVIDQWVEVPALDRSLRAQPTLTLRPRSRRPIVGTGFATRVSGISCAVKDLRWWQLRFQRFVRVVYKAVSRARVDGMDSFLNLLWTEGSVLVVEPVSGAV